MLGYFPADLSPDLVLHFCRLERRRRVRKQWAKVLAPRKCAKEGVGEKTGDLLLTQHDYPILLLLQEWYGLRAHILVGQH